MEKTRPTKCGEASIRGINAVTRSAGRLLLDI